MDNSTMVILILVLVLAFTNFPASLCRESKEFKICSQTFNCGNLTDLTYPFYGNGRPDYCGHPGFELTVCDDPSKRAKLTMKSQTFLVIDINSSSSTISVARDDYYQRSGCPTSSNLANIEIDFTRFQYTAMNENITMLYGNCSSVCSNPPLKAMTFPCPVTATQNFEVCYLTKKMMLDHNISETSCPNHRLFLPVQRSDDMAIDKSGAVMQVSFATWHGFELKWSADNVLCQKCVANGGQCGHDWLANKFFCFCTDESKCPFSGSIQEKRKILTKSKIAMIASFSTLGTVIFIATVAICLTRRASNKYVLDSQTGKPLNVEAFLRCYGSPGPKRYSYTDLKKITNSFKDKLGEGGYGTVYKGKLQDGHLVAVKILKKLKAEAEEFINEVSSIGSTNHINVVTLLGFCYDGQKRALVYDFQPNGSLEKFVYGGVNHEKLSWEKLFEIAVGIARGLEYLHRGCNTRILHFDIKPHNILLDENFCPKISDFGLAKLCPQKGSLVSMSEARGTVGYIAPEVFLRSFGGVSYKSDVYSYGMLVLEMVGCRRNAEVVEGRNSSEQYFPQWIYKQLERGEEINEEEMLRDKERELQKKMIIVSLWCVQTNPSSRPAMGRVVDMLEGTLESLHIPPMLPFSYSLRSQSGSSSTSSQVNKLQTEAQSI